MLDTHLLLWAAGPSPHLPSAARRLIDDPANQLIFSAASLWEIAIKSALGRPTFQVDAALFRRNLLNNLYQELPVTGEHAVAIARLPPLHRDPFDRMLVAQSAVEGITLLTADPLVAQYSGPGAACVRLARQVAASWPRSIGRLYPRHQQRGWPKLLDTPAAAEENAGPMRRISGGGGWNGPRNAIAGSSR